MRGLQLNTTWRPTQIKGLVKAEELVVDLWFSLLHGEGVQLEGGGVLCEGDDDFSCLFYIEDEIFLLTVGECAVNHCPVLSPPLMRPEMIVLSAYLMMTTTTRPTTGGSCAGVHIC